MKGLAFLLCITVVYSANLPRSKKVQLLGSCSADSQCDSGLVCNNGKCRAQVGEVCGGNADCVSLKCFNGKCQKLVEAGGACLDTSYCVKPSVCLNGKCAVEQLGSCSADSQCANGLVCFKGQCRAIAGGPCPGRFGKQYLKDDYCSEGLTCNYFGKCLTKPGARCKLRSECAVDWCDDYRNNYGKSGLNTTCRGRDGDACEDNSGCTARNICFNKKCLNLGGYDCWWDHVCVSGKCGPDKKCRPAENEPCSLYNACQNSSQVCSDYKCVAPPSCINVNDCAYGLDCSNGKCLKLVEAGGACLDTSYCVSSLRCLSGKCQKPVEAGGACLDTSFCVKSLVCLNGKCAVKQLESCSADSQCANGLVCYDSQCRVKPGGRCDNDEECVGNWCDDYRNNYGKSGLNTTCRGSGGDACEDNSSCSPIDFCFNKKCLTLGGYDCWLDDVCASGKCGPDNKCQPAENEPCSLHNACQNSSQVCSDYKCVAPPSCINDNDCAYGLDCSYGKCLTKSGSCLADSQCAYGNCSNGQCY